MSERLPDRRVVNGIAFDRADLPAASCYVLPAGARVERDDRHPGLFLAKEVGFGGYPPRPITPETARRFMFLASRTQDDCLEVGIVGEWWNIEGMATLRLLARVRSSAIVRIGDGLTGPSSRAALQEFWMPGPSETDWWYENPMPAAGWTRIADAPDPSRTAAR